MSQEKYRLPRAEDFDAEALLAGIVTWVEMETPSERPDLIEIRSSNLGQGKDAKRVFDFTVNVGIRRPRDKDQAANGARQPAAGQVTPVKHP